MIKQREDALQAEQTTKQLAGARYESNVARMAQNVAARKGSLKGKTRKCICLYLATEWHHVILY